MAGEKESPGNEFKRVLAVAMKTIAEDPELSVTFGNENPSLTGNKAKLPQIGNELKAADIAIVRGLSDSYALRIANHNDKVHSHYQPQGKNARAVFEAVEQARIEALGANAMPGMKTNLAAMMDDRYRKKDVARYTDRKDAPLDEAVALLVREKLTGEIPPEGARTMVDLWRPWIEEKASSQIAHLMESIHDQAAFARMSRDIIAALDMGDELGEDPDQSDENDENNEPEEESGERQETPEGEEQESSQQSMEEMQDAEGESEAAETDAQQMDVDEQQDDQEGEEESDGEEPWRPQLPFSSLSNEDFYKVFTNQFDEEISPACRAWWRGLPTACSAS